MDADITCSPIAHAAEGGPGGRRALGGRGTPCGGERQGIYAVTVPLVVEAARRVLSGSADTIGVASVGARFGATDFLDSMSPDHLETGPELTVEQDTPVAVR